MGFIDELKKLTHPYEDEDEEFEDFEQLAYEGIGFRNKRIQIDGYYYSLLDN